MKLMRAYIQWKNQIKKTTRNLFHSHLQDQLLFVQWEFIDNLIKFIKLNLLAIIYMLSNFL